MTAISPGVVPRRRAPAAALACLTLLAVALALASLRYLFADVSAAPPELRGNFVQHGFAFVVHATAAAIALLLLPLQLVLARLGRPAPHRRIGFLYLAAVTAAACAAVPLALSSFAGPAAATGFIALALLWLSCTWSGVAAARKGHRDRHAKWMWRSAALTLSAITLRLYLPLPPLLGLAYEDGYKAIAWACWLPNLVLCEWWLRRSARRSRPAHELPVTQGAA
jgi:uncharacterized membrane protein